jgi:hypothetical protein
MENIFHQQVSNSHPVGLRHCSPAPRLSYYGNPLVACAWAQGMRTAARRAVEQTGFGRGNRSRGRDGFYFKPKRKLNQTKQIGKYIFMENIFHQQGSNPHPEHTAHKHR